MAERKTWQEQFERSPRRAARFETMSGVPVEPVYGARGRRAARGVPFTRGIYANMYRARLWTMRQFAGFGSAADTNQRFKDSPERGENGLSVAFDMPTLARASTPTTPGPRAEVKRAGVAIASQDDMETLFSGLPLGNVSTSMTINSAAAPDPPGLLHRRGLREHVQPRPLGHAPERHLEGVPGAEGVRVATAPSMRLVTDVMRVLLDRAAALARRLELGLPHPRGGLDRAAGARLHVQ